jgi:hypothetical protein
MRDEVKTYRRRESKERRSRDLRGRGRGGRRFQENEKA